MKHFSTQQAVSVFDFASSLKWSTLKSKSEIDHIMKHQKRTMTKVASALMLQEGKRKTHASPFS